MKINNYPKPEELVELLKRPIMKNKDIDSIVRGVLDEVKLNGDSAVINYTEKFDKVTLKSLEVSDAEFNKAEDLVSDELKAAIQTARENIEKFHLSQRLDSKKIETTQGVTCWQKSVAIEKVGLYIPGGTAPLFSTVLMLGIPAVIAGCKEIVFCTPPNKEGKIHPAILFAAKTIGITKVFKAGGIQAIGAMAYGTETIPQVYKIFGPGNQYVTAAKQLVFRDGTAIDMPAGPSEVAVMADESAYPEFIVSDLLSQAEHGVDSQVILVTTSESLVTKVQKELDAQLSVLPRKEIAEKAIEHARIIVVKDKDVMIDVINQYAPEHLIISTNDCDSLAERIVNAGSVFIGHYTPESAGDYASGTNHTLPTYGFARNYNGVNLDNYVKKITYQKITEEGMLNLGPVIEVMAETEQLHAHKNAVSLRIKKIKENK